MRLDDAAYRLAAARFAIMFRLSGIRLDEIAGLYRFGGVDVLRYISADPRIKTVAREPTEVSAIGVEISRGALQSHERRGRRREQRVARLAPARSPIKSGRNAAYVLGPFAIDPNFRAVRWIARRAEIVAVATVRIAAITVNTGLPRLQENARLCR